MAKRIDSISPRSKKPTEETAPETKPVEVEAETPAEAPVEAAPAVQNPPAEEPAAPAASEPETTAKEEKPEEEPTKEGEQKDQEDVTFESLFPEPSVVMSGPPAWLWWILLVLGAIGLGFLAYDLTRNRIDAWLDNPAPSPTASVEASPEASPTPTPEASPSPTATPTATPGGVDKSTVTLRVLNGTTQTGAAGVARDTLQAAGFTVRTIGNANNQNYATTTIYYQAGRAAEAEAVKESLGNANAIVEESTLANPDMVLVVIGQR